MSPTRRRLTFELAFVAAQRRLSRRDRRQLLRWLRRHRRPCRDFWLVTPAGERRRL